MQSQHGGIFSRPPSNAMESVPEYAPSFSDDCSTLIEGFLDTIARMTGAIAGSVRVASPDGRELHMMASFGLPAGIGKRENLPDPGCSACGMAMRDLEAHSNACKQSGCGFFGKSVVTVPLENRGKTMGMLNLFYAAGQDISDAAMQNLRAFGELLGMALENSRRSRESRRISLMTERQWMANEIHDSVAQTLVYAGMRMSLLLDAIASKDENLSGKYAHDVKEALTSGQHAVRELITHFRSRMDPLGLQHALLGLVEEFSDRTGIALDYANRIADLELPLEHELQVFHIVREVLSNIATHSGATHASLAVGCNEGRYVFAIEDNGSGMPSVDQAEGHYGLAIMQERAARLGGAIELESSGKPGTRVRLSFPVTPMEAAK